MEITPFLALDTDVTDLGEELAESLSELRDMDPIQLWNRIRNAFASFWPTLLSAILFFVAGYVIIFLLCRLIKRVLYHSKVDKTLHHFIQSTVRFILTSILLLTCLGVMGVPLTPLITLLGAAGLALSLAMQDSLGNVAGGIMILLNRPFAAGNFVEIGGTTGTVKQIRLVYTVLATVDNKEIYIPNGDVAKGVVTNFSAEPVRRLDIVFPVRADSDIERAKRIIFEVIRTNADALENPSPVVRVTDHTYMQIQITCQVWAETANLLSLKAYLIQKVREQFNQEGFCAPYRSRETGGQ